MDILIHMRKSKIVDSDTLPRLNYYKNACVASPQMPLGAIITSWIWFEHMAACRKGMKEKKRRKLMNTAALSQPFTENFGREGGPQVVFCMVVQNLKLRN